MNNRRKQSSKIISPLDNSQTTIERSKILQQKYFLKRIYIDFYQRLFAALSKQNRKGTLVELGSGGGFIKKIIPSVTTSDILKLPNVDMHFTALKMPFKNASINAFVMIDVFHHIPNSEQFLTEAHRCLKKEGQIIMIEPANTYLGKIIYKYFHHEPYNPQGGWSFKSTGPLSGANSALAWIVFLRDRKKFEERYPSLKIVNIQSHTPFRYLFSGGFSIRQLLPNSFYTPLSFIESLLKPFHAHIGMFYTITLEKEK